MDPLFILIIRIAFLVIITGISLISALSVFIFVRYGRTRAITLVTSALFISLFLILTTAAYSTLQSIISNYV